MKRFVTFLYDSITQSLNLSVNPLNANPIKWLNTLKQLVRKSLMVAISYGFFCIYLFIFYFLLFFLYFFFLVLFAFFNLLAVTLN